MKRPLPISCALAILCLATVSSLVYGQCTYTDSECRCREQTADSYCLRYHNGTGNSMTCVSCLCDTTGVYVCDCTGTSMCIVSDCPNNPMGYRSTGTMITGLGQIVGCEEITSSKCVSPIGSSSPLATPSMMMTATATPSSSASMSSAPSPSPSSTMTATTTPTPTNTPIIVPSPSQSPTPSTTTSATPSTTMTAPATPTPSTTPTPTSSTTSSATPSSTMTSTATATATATPTSSTTPSVTPSTTMTSTATATATPTSSTTPSASPSTTMTSTATATPTPSSSPTPSMSMTPTPSTTPSMSMSPTPSTTPSMSMSPTPSTTPSMSMTPTSSPTPSVTPTPTSSTTPSATPSSTMTSTATATPTPSTSPTPSTTPSMTLSTSPTPSPVVRMRGETCDESSVCEDGYGCSCLGRCARNVELYIGAWGDDSMELYLCNKLQGHETEVWSTDKTWIYSGPCPEVFYYVRNPLGGRTGMMGAIQEVGGTWYPIRVGPATATTLSATAKYNPTDFSFFTDESYDYAANGWVDVVEETSLAAEPDWQVIASLRGNPDAVSYVNDVGGPEPTVYRTVLPFC